MMHKKSAHAFISWLLVVIGAVNWGLVGVGGFFDGNWNVVNLLLGNWPTVEWLVYILVGIAGLVTLFGCRCKGCTENCQSCGAPASTGGAM